MDFALKFAVIFVSCLHIRGTHAHDTSNTHTGKVGCAIYRQKMIFLFKRLSKQPFSNLQETSSYKKILLQNMKQICPPITVPQCPHSKYSTIDGTCNNKAHRLWGSSNTAQLRYLEPAYDNGVDSPRTVSALGGSLPSTRIISNAIFKQAKTTVVGGSATMMHMTFGQFLAHDFIFTPVETGAGNTPIKCCTLGHLIKNRDECFPIMIPDQDKNIEDKCMEFVRSSAAIPDGVNFQYVDETREQLNEITSYIDASAVYGSTEKKMKELRSFNGGKLKLDKYSRLPEGTFSCAKVAKGDYCQNAGDKRVNVVPTLGSMHWLWVLEHNRIADHLKQRHTDWNDDKIFQESRKILIAMLQHIVYKSYLPTVIGGSLMEDYNLNVPTNGYTYNPGINAGTHNAFAAAAFRFGHSQIQKFQITTPIERTSERPHLLETNSGKGYTDFTTWLSASHAAKSDVELASAVRNNLFPLRNGSYDLGAINTQRGRDHGIPRYNAWRVWAGLPKAEDLDGLTKISKENVLKLKAAYKHVDDIDLYPGGLSETHVHGGMVGPTFAALIGKQFHNFKFGDRFWYENNIGRHEGFTSKQLVELRKITYARIVCNNVQADKIQRDVFKVVNAKTNPLVPCSDIPTVNLDQW